MITKQFAKKQVSRFWDAALHFLPQRPDELIRALLDAPSEANAEAVVNAIIEESSQCPTPAELRGAIRARREDVGYWSPPPTPNYECKRCQDTGVYGGELFGKYAGPWKWCSCPSGEALRNIEGDEIAAGKRTLDAIAEGNQAREKLIRRFGTKSMQAMLKQQADGVPNEERYARQ